jgi:CBS domain-containing protein
MITVGELLKNKGSNVWSLSPDNTVYEAIEMMAEKNIGAVVILTKNKLSGIVTERDYTRKVILQGLTSNTTKIKDIMTTHIYHTYSEQTVDECMVMMKEKKIRHLPVLDNGQLVGLIAISDVITEIIKEHEYTIKQLENYINYEESYEI